MKRCSLVVRNKIDSEIQQNCCLLHLHKGDILSCPELMVPVFCFLPQMSQFPLQLGLVLRDVVYDRPQVRQSVWWSNPIIFRS